MDPISVGLLFGLIAQSAAGEIGKSAWRGLTQLTHRAFGDESRATQALEQARENEAGVADLAEHLADNAANDPSFAELLRAWVTHTQQAATDDAVVNTIGGQAQIHGHAVQARDVGSIRLGGQDVPK
ncbi:hypothetical protein [Nocardia fusca]|uniref:Uncharacterized protein n=1 Tax=Nocardia fusca TaxID=941183 RepID=A0ABV3FGZ6_9NOCA